MRQSIIETVGTNAMKAIPLLIGLWTIASPAIAAPLNQQANDVVNYLVGEMDTSVQAATNPKISNIKMTTCKIRVAGNSDTTLTYLYQEQANVTKLNQPYRQRFLEISPHPPTQRVRSLSFRPSNPKKWVNFCNQPESTRVVQSQELGKPVCTVFLKPNQDAYVGRTPIDGCPANVSGAVRITNQITLRKTGMETWDRGFDATGKQVWGAESNSYQFRKR